MNREVTERAVVPTTLEGLLGYSSPCKCGVVHSVEIRFAYVSHGALDRLSDEVKWLGAGRKVGVLVDRVTHSVAGERVEKLLEKAGREVRVLTVPDGEGARPHATAENVQFVKEGMSGRDLVVAVGSGTINDLAKLASFELEIPYIIVATAPSMNGYTSAIAAIMKDGLKCTVDCHQPVGVIADLAILGTAPHHLVAAGLGDLESKPSSTADFRLSTLIRDTYYCPVPERVVFEAERRAADAAADLKSDDPEALRSLTEALLLSGISMKLAGSSSPASGGEHLISHHWDMTASSEGRVEGWHGAQVGVATIVTSTLYEYLRNVRPESIDVDRIMDTRLSVGEMRNRILRNHGAWGKQAVKEYFEKHLDEYSMRNELRRILGAWGDIWTGLEGVLRPPERVRSTLFAAGAPVTVKALGLTPEHLRRSYLMAREIRGRYTVLDFAAELGLLEPPCDDILMKSGCLG